MSTFERDNYQWRETYFVLFDSCQRPTLKHAEKVLHALSNRFQLSAGTGDADGRFESLTVFSPDDYAALDISYVAGEEVIEQGRTMYEELKGSADGPQDRAKLARIRTCDARFDLMHFEEITAGGGDEDFDEMLDPSALLIVIEALAELTKGVGVDPQSGTLV